MNFESYFRKYEAIVEQVDAIFKKVEEEYQACVKCHIGCSDCCHALFDLTLIEALYIKSTFDKVSKAQARELILDHANHADREIYRIKRKAYKDHESGKSENVILEEMASKRVRCPLLNSDDKCELYQVRPITCRLYGIPTAIGGRAHTCGLSGFKQGAAYPTVKLDAIQSKLYQLSTELTQEIGSKYSKLGELLVPVSMMLLTDYTEAYLGVEGTEQVDPRS